MINRLTVLFLTVAVLNGVTLAANRAQTWIEGKKKAYYEETGKIEEGLQKKKEQVTARIDAEMLAGIEAACKQGRLDVAEQFYVLKTGMEKGRSLTEGDLTFLADKASSIREMQKERDREAENGCKLIAEINLKYLNQCQELLRKTKEIDNSEFNEMVSYKQLLTLPFGAVSPREGKKPGGLDCRIYTGEFKNYSEITGGKELARIFTPSPGMLLGMPKENFGVIWEGFYYAEKDGEYEFILSADDEARLFVNGQNIVESQWNGYVTGAGSKVFLVRGWHPVKLECIQRVGGRRLVLQARTPGQEKAEDISPSSFSARRDEAVLSGL